MSLTSGIFGLLAFLLPTPASVWTHADIEGLLKKMTAAYEVVKDYQAHLEIRAQREDGSFQTTKALYTFRKPHQLRLDFESPYPGMVIIYPDKNGKVVIRPSGWAHFFKLRLAPDNLLLEVAPGQRIDQTDLGLLIRNISQSLTDRRHGQVKVTDKEGRVRIRVLADDHFREGLVTLYQFLVDTELWLPIEVQQSTRDGILERRVIFRDLKVNVGVPEDFFEADGE